MTTKPTDQYVRTARKVLNKKRRELLSNGKYIEAANIIVLQSMISEEIILTAEQEKFLFKTLKECPIKAEKEINALYMWLHSFTTENK